jgi:hypothetical protein
MPVPALGAIFNVRKKAQQVISSMQHQVSSAQAKIAGLKPVTVFDYDSGDAAPFTGPGLAMPTALISLGGGANNLRQPQAELDVGPGRGRQGRTPVHHHERLRHPDGQAEGEVPGDQRDHQETSRQRRTAASFR